MKRGRVAGLCLAPLLAAACGRVQGFEGEAPPLASFNVVFHGDLAPLRPSGVTGERALRVALVWGAQWLTEPFCVLPAESQDVAAVIEAGCRDPFGFVPLAVSQSAPIAVDVPSTLTLTQLPAPDVMVGDVTARVAYASLMVFDDRDGSGTLELSARFRPIWVGPGPPPANIDDVLDVVYGASFVTMTAPDQRVAFREGAFDSLSAFYPRAGCDPPPPGFSVLAAGGFTREAALAALLGGQLPPQDPAACAVSAPADATIAIDARRPAELKEISCEVPRTDSSVRYREPPPTSPGLEDRPWACAHLPSFGAGATGGASPDADLIQLVVASHPDDRCRGLSHFTLRGCREDVSCTNPDWDLTASPPAWWPCGP